MQVLSMDYLCFLLVLVVLYYLIPLRIRWIVLLIASIYFYFLFGIKPFILILVLSLFVYAFGLIVDSSNKKKNQIAFAVSLIILFITLLFFKIYQYLDINNIIFPVGISYYLFSLISYLSDVYHKKVSPEKNVFKFLLYVMYFPKITEGPISKYRLLNESFYKNNNLTKTNLSIGVQRMLFGFFKIYVIESRINGLLNAIIEKGSLSSLSGSLIVFYVFLYTIKFYMNFSGCMDIVIGSSKLFAIDLDENFKRPFLSKTVSELWRRWHITLHAWFNDYVYMPVFTSKINQKVGIFLRNKYNNNVGKIVMKIIPVCIVWIFTALWHGVSFNYLAWGIYWIIFIIIPIIFSKQILKIKNKLRIKDKSKVFSVFQILRTFIIFSFSNVLILGKDFNDSIKIFDKILTNFNINDLLNISSINYEGSILLVFLLILLIFVKEICEENKKCLDISCLPLPVRSIIYAVSILMIIMFGLYGSEEAVIEMNYKYF